MFKIILLILSVFILGCGKEESAKSYPTKAIQLIVPYKAGGDTDLNARILAKGLQEELKKPVVIVNIEGGSGSVAARDVKDAKTDGYKLIFWHSSIILNELKGISNFGPEAFDIAVVPNVSDVGVWVVNSKSNIKSLDDAINQLKENPKSLSYASAVGNYSHLQALIFEEKTGTQLKKIDLGGTSNNIASLLGNHVDIVPIEYGLAKDYIESGDFRVIGSVTEKRSDYLKDIPTFKEQGVDMTNGFEKFYFVGFPKNSDPKNIEIFNNAIKKVMSNEEILASFEKLMFTPTSYFSETATNYINEKEELYNKYKDKLINDQF